MGLERVSPGRAAMLPWSDFLATAARKVLDIGSGRGRKRLGMEETMLRTAIAVVIAALALAWLSLACLFSAPARAQEGSGPSDSARYTFHRVQDSFLRLDARNGQVSHCGWNSTGWFCRVVPDERMALESEIARLQTSNIALKKELLARGLPLPDGIKADPPVSRDNEVKLPSDAELDRMMTFMEKVWRRMVEMMVNLQRDMLRKS
jgi:hypothetical protein